MTADGKQVGHQGKLVGSGAAVPSTRSARAGHRAGLGRGLAALIPLSEDSEMAPGDARPLDVLFPGRSATSAVASAGSPEARPDVPRGGSARDLLRPPTGGSRGRRSEARSRTRTITGAATVVSRETVDAEDSLVSVPGTSFGDLPLALVIANTRQPRQNFDEEELEELAESIREVGVLEPVVVRPIDTSAGATDQLREALAQKPDARYELVMGERRLRASEIAGRETIPAIVRRTADEDLLRDALLENLHRSDLNPLEEAAAYQQLMRDFGATQEELAARVARSRSQIANTLRLLKLPASVQRRVAAGVLSAGHARALLSLDDGAQMEVLAQRIVSEGLSVRSTEEIARTQTRPASSRRLTKKQASDTSPLGERLARALSERFETRVTVTERRTRGRVVIEFAGAEDLERLAGLILGGQID